MFKTSSAAGKDPLEISLGSKGEESSNHNNLVQNNLKSPFEIMVKSFSSLCRLLKTTVWANKFIKNCQSNEKITGILTLPEITEDKVKWIKHAQYKVFDTMGVKNLQNNDVITLGRFNSADIPEETKVPIYLPTQKVPD